MRRVWGFGWIASCQIATGRLRYMGSWPLGGRHNNHRVPEAAVSMMSRQSTRGGYRPESHGPRIESEPVYLAARVMPAGRLSPANLIRMDATVVRLSLRVQSKSFRLPVAAELLSLCVAKEKDNQRERPPRLALAGRPARQVREPGPGFSTAHPCAGEKESTSCRLPRRGLSTPTHRRTGAPGRAAGHPGPLSSEKPEAHHVQIEGQRTSVAW